MKYLRNYIGDRAFYRKVAMIAIPVMLQTGITNMASLLDNVMVGRLGTWQMSGVAIINQLVFVFHLCIFGAVSGASIYGTQFYGAGNYEGLRNTFRYKLLLSIILSIAGISVFVLKSEYLISLYLRGEGARSDALLSLAYAQQYMVYILIGLPFYTLSQVYASTLRETQQGFIPMQAGIISVIVNLVLNYILIFGNMGAPALGVQGAAIATMIARITECGFVAFRTHSNTKVHVFAKGLYSTLKIPVSLVIQISKKAFPLLINEAMWATGMAFLTQCYSTRGLEVVAAFNITNTIVQLFNVSFMGMGTAVAIIIGQLLGANKIDEAIETDKKMIFTAVMACVISGLLLGVVAPLYPQIYESSDSVKNMAISFIIISAILLPAHGFTNASYFTLRSGGKMLITFIFDGGFVWALMIPFVFILTRYTGVSIVPLYAFSQSLEIVKAIIGGILVRKRKWVVNIVNGL